MNRKEATQVVVNTGAPVVRWIGLLGVILVVLKVLGLTAISWWFVLLPFYWWVVLIVGLLAVGAAGGGLIYLVCIIIDAIQHGAQRRRRRIELEKRARQPREVL